MTEGRPELAEDYLPGCARCESRDNVTLILESEAHERLCWCSCGAVSIYDPNNDVTSPLVVHDFCPGWADY